MASLKNNYGRCTKEELRKGCHGTKFIQSEKNKSDLVKIAKEYDADPDSFWTSTTKPRPAQFFNNIMLEIGSTMHKHAMNVGEIGLYRGAGPQANKAKNGKKKEKREAREKQNGGNENGDNEVEEEPDVPTAPEQSNKRKRKKPDTRPSNKRQNAGKTNANTVTVHDPPAPVAAPSDALQIEPNSEVAETPSPGKPEPGAAGRGENPPGLMDLDETGKTNDQAPNLNWLSPNEDAEPSDDEEDYAVYYRLASRTELRSACSGTDITQNGKNKPNLEAEAIKYDLEAQAYHERQGKGLKTTPATHLLECMVVEEGSPLYKLLEAKKKLNLVACVRSKKEKVIAAEVKSDMAKDEDAKGKTPKKAEKTATKKSVQRKPPTVAEVTASNHLEPEPKVADDEVSQELLEDDELGNEKEMHETERTHEIGNKKKDDLLIDLHETTIIKTMALEIISTDSENGSTSSHAQDISETTNTTTARAQKLASNAAADTGRSQTNGELNKHMAGVAPTRKSARVLNKLAQVSKQSSHMHPKVKFKGTAALQKAPRKKKPKPVWPHPFPMYSKDSGWPPGIDDTGITGWPWPNNLNPVFVGRCYKNVREDAGLDANGNWNEPPQKRYPHKYCDSMRREAPEEIAKTPAHKLNFYELVFRSRYQLHDEKEEAKKAAEAQGIEWMDPDIEKDRIRKAERDKHDMYLRDDYL